MHRSDRCPSLRVEGPGHASSACGSATKLWAFFFRRAARRGRRDPPVPAGCARLRPQKWAEPVAATTGSIRPHTPLNPKHETQKESDVRLEHFITFTAESETQGWHQPGRGDRMPAP